MGESRQTAGKSQRQLKLASTTELQDLVYRAMLRLEVGKPNAASELCDCLCRAWRQSEIGTEPEVLQRWLQQITPLCLELLTRKVAGIETHHG